MWRRKRQKFCINHVQQAAVFLCEKCQKFFCKDCVETKLISETFTAYICKECGGRCLPLDQVSHNKRREEENKKNLPERKIPPAGKRISFLIRDLLAGLFYPFLGRGIFILALFSVGMWALYKFSQAEFWLYYIYAMVYVAYFILYLYAILDYTIRGVHRLPPLIKWQQWKEYAWPVSLCVGEVWVVILPAIIYFFLTHRIDKVFTILLGIGFFLLPMGIVQISLAGNFMISRYILNLFKMIFRTLPVYFFWMIYVAGIFLGLHYLLFDYLGIFVSGVEVLPSVTAVYFLIVVARSLGIFAHKYRTRLIFP